MFKNLKKRTEGFTIIEVLIVLSIAGLIMLIVFLAVPALQRNSRNQQRKTDVANILSAVNEYSTNNNGLLPVIGTQPTLANGVLTIANPTAGSPTAQTKVGFYNVANVAAAQPLTVGSVGIGAAATVQAAGVFIDRAHDYAVIYPGSDCAAGGATVAGSPRSIAVVYEIETGANVYAQQCQG